MRLIAKPEMPDAAKNVLSCLDENGFSAFLVGGAVRDLLLGISPHDYDIACSALPEDMLRLFPGSVSLRPALGSVTVPFSGGSAEVTTFRIEGGYSDLRHPDSVTFASSIEEDLVRRDFTVNAMAMDLAGEIIDPLGGMKDLEAGILRCVGDPMRRFSEDSLRMLRLFRFRSRFGFEIEAETEAALRELAPSCSVFTAELIQNELLQILLSDRPEMLSDVIALDLTVGYILSGRYDLSPLKAMPKKADIRLCLFSRLLNEYGAISSESDLLSALHFAKPLITSCCAASRICENFPKDKNGIKLLLSRYPLPTVICAAYVSRIPNAYENVQQVVKSGECYSLSGLAIGGRELVSLGCRPGRTIGDTLNALLVHVIENPQDNYPEKLTSLAIDIIDKSL